MEPKIGATPSDPLTRDRRYRVVTCIVYTRCCAGCWWMRSIACTTSECTDFCVRVRASGAASAGAFVFVGTVRG